MPNNRTYRLLCPIARALDKVGDRWTLLILRDLHAGPARFSDLHAGLTGLASNLLASRLRQLQDDGLIRHHANAHGTQLYELTAEGEATAPLLFELGNYGSRFPPADDIRRPGNLRTIVVNMQEALRRSVPPATNLHAELVVDDESFSVRIEDSQVSVRYEPDPDAPVSIATEYEPLIDVIDGRIPPNHFVKAHIETRRGSTEQVEGFLALWGPAFATT